MTVYFGKQVNGDVIKESEIHLEYVLESITFPSFRHQPDSKESELDLLSIGNPLLIPFIPLLAFVQ